MSILFCKRCDKNVDTDHDSEHFTENEECIKWLDNLREEYDKLLRVYNKLIFSELCQAKNMIKLKASHDRLKGACLDARFDLHIRKIMKEKLTKKQLSILSLLEQALKQAL